THTATELKWEARCDRLNIIETGELEVVVDIFIGRGVALSIRAARLLDLAANAHRRVQVAQRILEDHRDLLATHLVPRLGRSTQVFLAVDADRPAGLHALRPGQQ